MIKTFKQKSIPLNRDDKSLYMFYDNTKYMKRNNRQITITVQEDALNVIDAAAKKDNRTRSNFLSQAGLEKAIKLQMKNKEDVK